MCGIVGAYYFGVAPPDLQNRLRKAMRLLFHRGPDSEGYYLGAHVAMGHCRLAIIDLKTGAQPLYNETQTLVLTMNGEIYDHGKQRHFLQSHGHQFTTNTDAEVLVHLFEEDAESLFSKVFGMFAVSIYDTDKDRLVIGRDYCGIKPLYYKLDDKHLVFASEVKAILAFENELGKLDKKSLSDYLTFQFVLADRTLFHGIKKLLPGSYMTCDSTGTHINQYWSPPQAKIKLDHPEVLKEYKDILGRAMERHLQSDVPMGFHLSGGIDTATIIELARDRVSMPFSTFSTGFHEGSIYDDQSNAEQYSKHIDSIHRKIYISSGDFFSYLPSVVWYMDEPSGDTGIVPQFATNQAAAESVRVVFSGHGADETIAGYSRHLLYYLCFAIRDAIDGTHFCRLGLGEIQEGLPFLSDYQQLVGKYLSNGIYSSPFEQYLGFMVRTQYPDSLLSRDMAESIAGYSPIALLQTEFDNFFRGAQADDVDVLDYALWLDFRYMLPPLLQMEDRSSMAYSVESRVPFLDRELVEFAFAVSSRSKLHKGVPKSLLRTTMNDKLPDYIISRKQKIGRPTPFNFWLKKDSQSFAHNVLLSDRCMDRGIFKPESVKNLLVTPNLFDRTIWAILNIELWHRLFVDTLVGDNWKQPPNCYLLT